MSKSKITKNEIREKRGIADLKFDLKLLVN